VVHPRTGLVVSREGGAWARLFPIFRAGVGGRLGSGRQYWSYISMRDEVGALRFLIDQSEVTGPVNLVAPRAATNAEVTAAMGQVMGRPTLLPVPKFALRLGAGTEMADEMLIGGARVVPSVLQAAGFEWKHPTLEPALRSVL
jgi:uncharacterized protein (TIGR01777 family)